MIAHKLALQVAAGELGRLWGLSLSLIWNPPIHLIMNSVCNWIQSDACSNSRMDQRVGLAGSCLGHSCGRPLLLGNGHCTCELKQTSILKFTHSIKDYGFPLQRDIAYSDSSLPRLPAPWQRRPHPPGMCTSRLDNLHYCDRYYRTKLHLRNCWIIALIVWRSKWRYKVTFSSISLHVNNEYA